MKLASTKFTDLVPVKQFHHKPMGIYDGGLLKLALGEACKLKGTTIIHSLRFFSGIAPMAQGL